MAVPSYNELLRRHDVPTVEMKETFPNTQLVKISTNLDKWELIGRSLGLDDPDINSIKQERDTEEEKRDKMLRKWKQRRGSAATYEELAGALLLIKRTDLAEIVVSLRLSFVTPPTSTNSERMEIATTLSDTPPTHMMTATSVNSVINNTSIEESLIELEEEFCQLVVDIEVTLEEQDIGLNMITRRFSMLPQSVKRWHETDKNYRETKHKILESTTTKTLFDNLTDLKHWNYMLPDTLAHILKGIKVDYIHQQIDKYKQKLSAFKRNTKLGDMKGIVFQLPEYCIELTMKVEGWEDKTIEEAEKAVGNIMHCGQHAYLGWKGVEPGCLKLTFILLEPIKIASDAPLNAMCRKHTVMNIGLNGELVYTDDTTELKVTVIITLCSSIDEFKRISHKLYTS